MSKTPRRLEYLVIKGRDLERAEEFCPQLMGLSINGRVPERMVFMSAHPESFHELAIASVGDDAPGPEDRGVGLAHMAWQMDTIDDLRALHGRLKSVPAQTFRIGDHGMSPGIYFKDPDGNEIEAFYELPRDRWPQETDVTGGAKLPLPLEEVSVAGDG